MNRVLDFFLNRINFSVENKSGTLENGIFYDNTFEFENKLFDLTDYGNLKTQEHIEKLIENLELLYKYEILWHTIKKN